MFKNIKRISIDKITNDSVINFHRKLKSISAKTTKALLIDISCFGPLAFSLSISNNINEFKKEKKIPVYTFGENTVLGPSLLILTAGDKVFADKFTMFGLNDFSIGKLNFNKFTNNRDINVKMIASGKHKVRLNPFEEVKPEDEEWVINILRKQKHIMIERLIELRGDKFNKEKYLALDDLFLADSAKEVGLIDDFESLDSILMKEFDSKKTKMVRNKITIADMLNMIHSDPKVEIDMNIEAEIVENIVDNTLKNQLI